MTLTRLTVEVISTEHTSQTYLTPPPVPLTAVFFLMTAIAAPVIESYPRLELRVQSTNILTLNVGKNMTCKVTSVGI